MLIQDNIQGHELELRRKEMNMEHYFLIKDLSRFMFSERKDLTS